MLQQYVEQMYVQWMDGAESIRIRYTSSIGAVETYVQEYQELTDKEVYQQVVDLYAQALRRNQKREYQYATTLTDRTVMILILKFQRNR